MISLIISSTTITSVVLYDPTVALKKIVYYKK